MNANLKTAILFTWLSTVSILSLSQDKVALMNGKVLEGNIDKVSSELVLLKTNKKGKEKTLELSRERIFALQYSDGTEKLLYEYDTLNGDFYTANEMRYYLKGQREAYNGSKPIMHGVATGLLSGAGGYVIGDSFLSLGVPIVSYAIFLGISELVPVKIDVKKLEDKSLLKQEAFIDGYSRVAKQKKSKNSILGAFAGVIAGVSLRVALD
ncbi:MAG: hypothetical protein MRY83_07920 [Flavobacteriales bacterium]|nr:hypothetical protein [Flavobacteriales bacterium]